MISDSDKRRSRINSRRIGYLGPNPSGVVDQVARKFFLGLFVGVLELFTDLICRVELLGSFSQRVNLQASQSTRVNLQASKSLTTLLKGSCD